MTDEQFRHLRVGENLNRKYMQMYMDNFPYYVAKSALKDYKKTS